MIITKNIEFDMGHRIPNHKSKCKNPHGHRYKVEIGVDGDVVEISGDKEEGMVMDFGIIKELLKSKIHDICDHGFMISREDLEMLNTFFDGGQRALELMDEEIKMYGYAHAFGAQRSKEWAWNLLVVPFIPTAENLAKWFYEKMEEALRNRDMKIAYIKLWETPNSTALYTGPPAQGMGGMRLG